MFLVGPVTFIKCTSLLSWTSEYHIAEVIVIKINGGIKWHSSSSSFSHIIVEFNQGGFSLALIKPMKWFMITRSARCGLNHKVYHHPQKVVWKWRFIICSIRLIKLRLFAIDEDLFPFPLWWRSFSQFLRHSNQFTWKLLQWFWSIGIVFKQPFLNLDIESASDMPFQFAFDLLLSICICEFKNYLEWDKILLKNSFRSVRNFNMILQDDIE